MGLAATIWRTGFRGLRLLDLPALVARSRFNALRQRYHAQRWIEVAQRLGAVCESVGGFTWLSRSNLAVVTKGGDFRLDDHLTLAMMGDKPLTFRLLAQQGLAVPAHAIFTIFSLAKARTLMAGGRAIVVKPAGGTAGGHGVTTGVTTLLGLIRAAWLASRYDPTLLAEEQIEGHSYRLLFLDGELIDAIRRDPPRLTGDGRNTIRDLVKIENRRRLMGQSFTALSPLVLDRDARICLKSQGLNPWSRPPLGKVFTFKRAVNQNTNVENLVVTNEVHVGTIATCSCLVRNLGVRFAGIDILARDIARPLTRDNGVIGEINTTPGLHHHHLVAARPDGRDVAAEITETLLQHRIGTIVLPLARPQVTPLKRRAS